MYRIDLEGFDNLRDLGGYRTADGRRVRSGWIFRGPRLSDIPPRGLEQFRSLGIRTVYDLRDPVQSARYPDPPIEGVSLRSAPAEIYSAYERDFNLSDIPRISEQEARRRIDVHVGHYRTIARQPAAIRQIFAGLLAEHDAPLYFHCTAGKDRTGIVAAVILMALGVPWPDIVGDYMLSAGYRARHGQGLIDEHLGGRMPDGTAAELVKCYISVDETWLEETRRVIFEEFGGADRYLKQAIGLDGAALDRLKIRYLEEI